MEQYITITDVNDLHAALTDESNDYSTYNRICAELTSATRTHNDYVYVDKTIAGVPIRFYYTITCHDNATFTCQFHHLNYNTVNQS